LVVLAVCGIATSAATAGTSTSATVSARCAGDTIYGELRSDAPAATTYALALFQQRVKHGPWLATGETVTVVTRARQRSYSFSFDVAAFAAQSYAIRGAGKDEIVRGDSCAPGHQVPEAPNTLLLAAAVAGVFGVSLMRRRRRQCSP